MIATMQIRETFILEFSRADFLDHYWTYRAGDHVTFIAPSDYGKTTLGMQLLQRTISPRLPVFNLAGKKRDKVMSEWTEALGLRLLKRWPPPVTDVFRAKPNGWTIWPPVTGDEDIDDPLHSTTFRKVMRHAAAKGNCIINLDEFGEMKELGLDKTTRAIHRRGRSSGVGLWGGLQGPVYAETHAYSQAMHLFLGYVTEKRHRERFAEISGWDSKLIEEAVKALPDRHWLYLRPRGRVMCVIGP